MGVIADGFASAFRDFVAAGIPASGPYNPSKSEIRALGVKVEQAIGGAASGLKFYATKAALTADTTKPLGTLAYVFADPTPANNTVYHYEAGGWVVDTAFYEGIAVVVQPLVDQAVAAAASAQSIASALKAATQPLTVVSASRPAGGWFDIGEEWKTFSAVITGSDLPAGRAISALVFGIALETNTTAINLEVWKTPVAAPDVYGPTGSDIPVAAGLYQLADLGISATGDFQRVALPLREALTKEAQFNIKWRVSAIKAGNIVANIAIQSDERGGVGLTQGQRGWAFRGAAVVPLASPRALSWEVESYAPLDSYPEQASADVALLSSADQVFHADATVVFHPNTASVLSVEIANGILTRFGQRISFKGMVPIERPSISTVTDAPYSLSYVNGVAAWPFMPAKMPSGNLTTITVKDASTSAVLAEGIDYIVDRRFGAFARATAGNARNVLISYATSQERYDLIYVDPEFAAVNVVKGATSIRDAAERMPNAGTKVGGSTLIDMRLPLYYARVTFSSIDLIKVWNLRDGIAREFEAQFHADQRRNRAALLPLLSALDKGANTIWSAMGDSITAIQSQVPDRLTPNGPYRDRATATGTLNTYLREGIIGNDLVDAVPHTFENSDGAGAVHTRFGRTWDLVTDAANRFAGTPTYRNYSIAGTSSDDAPLGMTNPERLAVWANDGADGHIIATGMNDTAAVMGSPGLFFNRIRQMIDAAYAGGSKGVIVWGCTRPQASAASDTVWLKVNRILRRAAETPGFGGRTAAFIDLSMIYYSYGAGTMGVAATDLTIANGFNHPGIRQHAIEGEFGRKLIFG